MLLPDWLVPYNVDMRLMLSRTQLGFYIMDYGGKPECQVLINEGMLGNHSGGWRQASALTVWNLTDVGVII